jgi:hypothetical protein
MSLIEVLRVVLLLVWLVSPPFLAALALLRWRRARTASLAKSRIVIVIGVAALANWILLLVLLIKAETPYGAIFQTSALTHALLLFACVAAVASLVSSSGRWLLFFANFLLITTWVVAAYAPAHWMGAWDDGKVTIDGQPTSASVFIAHPWDSEAEAIVFVHIPAASDYFLSFGEEKVRLAGKHEYLRLPGGVWCLPSLRDMAFVESLPPNQLNQFRIASPQGWVVSVQF